MNPLEFDINECLELLKEAAGTIRTVKEIRDSGDVPCSCDQCNVIHKIQDFLDANGITWEHCE